MSNSSTNHIRIKAAERRVKAFNLRKAGLSYSQIARELGITKPRVYMIIREELDNLLSELKESKEQVVKMEEERLDMLLRAVIEKAARGDYGAIDRVLRIMERRARLLGLDAPQKLAPTDPTGMNPYALMDDEQLRVTAQEILGQFASGSTAD